MLIEWLAAVLYSFGVVSLAASIVLPLLAVDFPASLSFMLAIAASLALVGLGPWRRIAVTARTFGSAHVELQLEQELLAMISVFHRVLLIENERYPSPQMRYTVLSLPAVLAASLTYASWSWLVGTDWLKCLVAGNLCLVVSEIFYFVIVARPWATRRRTIRSPEDLSTLERELRRQRPRILPRFIRNVPALRHFIKSSDEVWWQAMLMIVFWADLTLFDLTNISSEGLRKEFRIVVSLMDKNAIRLSQVLFICAKREECVAHKFLEESGLKNFPLIAIDEGPLSSAQRQVILERARRARREF
jgi:hypothetical protein